MTDATFDHRTIGRRALIGGGAALAAGVAVGPFLGGTLVGAEGAGSAEGAEPDLQPQGYSLPVGASRFVPLDPFRIADTRAGRPQKNFERHNPYVISVPIRNVGGAPGNATAAVLTITAINRGGPAFVTAFPFGQNVPTASNINLSGPGHTMSNLVTVKTGVDGRVAIYVEGTADLIVDLAGAYEPVTGAVKGGRMFVRPTPVRALDTRSIGQVGAGQYANVVLPLDMVPSHASAVSINLTATRPKAAGYFTAYPVAPGNDSPPDASNLNVSGPGDTRAIAAIVKVGQWDATGRRAFRVFSSHGGDVIVDVNGFVTGEEGAEHTDGLFVPLDPTRRLDTRSPGQIGRMWQNWTVEFSMPSAWSAKAQAAVMNLTTTNTRAAGFVTAYAAGDVRPNTSNLNPTGERQTIANHAIVRTSTRGVAVYHATGGHVIADLAGYYTGLASAAPMATPFNPEPPVPPMPYILHVPRLGITAQVLDGDANHVVDNGHVWHWGGTGYLGQRTNMALFAHRTEANGLLRYQHHLNHGDELLLKSVDGRTWRYVYAYHHVTDAKPTNILAATRYWDAPTVSLVSCTKPDRTPTSLDYRLITAFNFDRWYE